MNAPPAAPTVLILASGRGERFTASGGQGRKLDALIGGTSVLARVTAAVRASGLPYHVEDAGHPGMGDSIAAAVRATRDANGWLVLPGDLPFAQPDTLRRVAAALLTHPEADVVVPAFRDQRGHPVGFSARMGAALAQIAGPQGAADVVRQATEKGRRVILAVDDPGIVFDIDTRDDLDRARAWLASHPHL